MLPCMLWLFKLHQKVNNELIFELNLAVKQCQSEEFLLVKTLEFRCMDVFDLKISGCDKRTWDRRYIPPRLG